MKKCVEGSHAIAEVVNLCRPAVVSAYPITPQTHIVEDLSKLKSDGQASFEFIRADSEFAAASIVLGASASGVRAYTATSSQGLQLMTEVLFTIAGMRLPVVMTCANRAVSAPINIWNDQQDSMTVRDSGWLMFYAEDNQEAVDMHLLAFKVAEKVKVPVMVNMDGFVLTHTYEQVDLPEEKQINAYLPKYKPIKGQYLDVTNPMSLGCFATPENYMEIREDLYKDTLVAKVVIKEELSNLKKLLGRGNGNMVEYYGDRKAGVVFVAMGSMIGTIKDTIDEMKKLGQKAAVLKVKCFRPFPKQEIIKALEGFKYVAVLDKSISHGQEGILASEVKACLRNGSKNKVQSFIVGLGGRDVSKEMVRKIYNLVKQKDLTTKFIK